MKEESSGELSKMRPRQEGDEEMDVPPIDELELMVDPNNADDVEEINNLLHKTLSYPSHKLTSIHCEAMRLGNFDL